MPDRQIFEVLANVGGTFLTQSEDGNTTQFSGRVENSSGWGRLVLF